MLSEIDTVSMDRQKKSIRLAHCRFVLDMLRRKVEEGRNDSTSLLNRCRLGTKYLAPNASTLTDPVFESNIVKIQNMNLSLLTDDKKIACQCLRLLDNETTPTESTSTRTIDEEPAKKTRQNVGMKRPIGTATS